jgi:hypothetical protein
MCSSIIEAIPLRWRRQGPHRLDLGVLRVQLLQRPAADYAVAVHDRPERDPRPAQRLQIQGVLALRRRDRQHLCDVLVEESGDLRTGQVVDHDFHPASVAAAGSA